MINYSYTHLMQSPVNIILLVLRKILWIVSRGVTNWCWWAVIILSSLPPVPE